MAILVYSCSPLSQGENHGETTTSEEVGCAGQSWGEETPHAAEDAASEEEGDTDGRLKESATDEHG